MGLVTIRGAITAENTKDDILTKTTILLRNIMTVNKIEKSYISSILFTATKDLDAAYPAVAARELAILDASLMCMQEMHVVDSLEKCIRVLITAELPKKQNEVKHIYLAGATILRPDITKDFSDSEISEIDIIF